MENVYKEMTAGYTSKLLLVDDRSENLLALSSVLDEEGYRCVLAHSGQEALSILLKDQDFSIILLDVQMPEMDGFETARLIQQYEKTRNIPIIFITAAYTSLNDMLKGYELSAVDYILKPFNEQILKKKVAVHVALYQKKQQVVRELQKLKNMSGSSALLVSKDIQYTPLRHSSDGVFDTFVSEYGQMLEMAVDEQIHKKENRHTPILKELIDRLCALNAAPKDVIDIHLAAVEKIEELNKRIPKNAYIEEGRMVLLETMGELASSHRRISLASSLKLENLIATVAEGVVYLNKSGKIVFHNKAAVKLLGYSSEDILDKNFLDLIQNGVQEDGSPFEVKKNFFIETFISNKSISNIIIGVDNRERQKRVWLLINASPNYISYKNELEGVYTTFMDITERVESNKVLEDEKLRYQTLFENIQDGVMIVDREGTILFANQKASDLFKRQKLIGEPFGIPLVDIKKKVTPIELLTPEMEVRYAMARSVHTLWNGEPVQQVTLHDYTEVHEKDEMMIAQSRQAAMGDMIAMIAHQWRQPITVVGMSTNNLELSLELGNAISKEDLEKHIETVTNQIQHLSQTIDDFRSFFKPTQEKKRTTAINVINNTLKLIGKSLENNNIGVTVNNKSNSELLIYENQLMQVFLNIINNAKDILKIKKVNDAKITISVEEKKKSVVINICDNGGGIDKEIIKRIGEPYFTTKEKNGTGLGIYMSKMIIQKHIGGSLNWHNKDKGACFCVTISK